MSIQRSGRPALGDTVVIDSWGACTVTADDDASIVRLRIEATGREVRVGERALAAMLANDPADALREQEAGR